VLLLLLLLLLPEAVLQSLGQRFCPDTADMTNPLGWTRTGIGCT
jgi:hypothetical protein